MSKKIFSTVLFLSIVNCLLLTISFAQQITSNSKQSTSWSANPFEQKVFIENKGQFDNKLEKGSSTILFGASAQGVDLFFTSGGLTYRHDEEMPMREEEKEVKRELIKPVPHYLSIEWAGANPNAEIIAAEPVSFYYTYGGAGKNETTTIKANAFKKIIYKNLYPNIDVEYVFPADSTGIKYSFLLHPGANPADIKMNYEGTSAIFIDAEGNAVIKSSFGEFIDHAPTTFYADTREKISSTFSLKNNIISFSFPAEQKISSPLGREGGVIIDPWTTNPSFIGYNAAFDVNYDINGNVYIYGSNNNTKLAKLDSLGVVQWIFDAVGFQGYGDFALVQASGTSFLVGGYAGGGSIFKVNALGVQIGTGTGISEMFRVEYNSFINQIVIGGGLSTNQAATIDTNLTTLVPVNVLSATTGAQDIALLAVEKNGSFCYMATSRQSSFSPPPQYDNLLIKCPLPGLVPLAFSVFDKHQLVEIRSITYTSPSFGPNGLTNSNGMNGMAVTPSWLYTYDSDSLKRWDKNTGALLCAIDVSPSAPTYGTNMGQIFVYWGGIAADDCDNIYVGMGTTIRQYNSSLALVNTIALPDTVYDVKLGSSNKLYACGRGFVTELNVTPNDTVTVTQLPASSCSACDGQATVSALPCGGPPSDTAYVWSPGGQITPTATGLCPGNYTVTVTNAGGCSRTATVTVPSTNNSLTVAAASTPAACTSCTGTATATPSGGTSYTYLWSTNAGSQTNDTAIALCAGTYTVTVSDGTCITTQTVTVPSNNPLTVATTTTPSDCSVNNGTATANPSGTAPYTYLWSNGATTPTIINLSSQIYSVTVTDASGCTKLQTASVAQQLPNITVTATSFTIVAGTSTQLAATGGGTYLWSPSTGLSCDTCANPIATPTVTTTYFVTVTGTNGCTNSAFITITVELPCGEIFIPNAFSPNQDGTNELECVMGGAACFEKLHFAIYDRWGQKIFETTNPNDVCWDGKFKGKLMNTAVFVYYLRATLTNGEKLKKEGNITLIR